MTKVIIERAPFGRLRPQLSSRSLWPSWTTYANSGGGIDTDTRAGTSCTYKVRHYARLPAHNIVARFCNYSETGNSEQDGPATITVKYAVLHNSVIYPATFGGQPSVTLAPGAQIDTDTIVGLTFAAGDVYHDLCYVQGPTDHSWPACYDIKGLTNFGRDDGYAANTDATATGTMTGTGASGWAFGPSAMLGTPAATISGDAVVIFGDSIASTVDDVGDEAFVARALDALGVPWLRLATSGDGFGGFSTLDGRKRRIALAQGAGNIGISEYGANDMRGPENNTLAMVQGWAIPSWVAMRTVIQRLYQTTCTPFSTGTAGSQTTVNNVVRSAWNDWLRAGAPMLGGAATTAGTLGAIVAGDSGHPLTGIIEVADIVEPSRNAGVWISSYFADGVHPNLTGVTAMAADVQGYAPFAHLDPLRSGAVKLVATPGIDRVALAVAS